MKCNTNYLTVNVLRAAAVLITLPFRAEAQGTFGNLNFEEANLTPVLGSPLPSHADNVPIANALPGWSVYYGGVQQSQINYNDPSLGATAVSLDGLGGEPVIDGSYSVLLQGGLSASAATIGQTSLIPVEMQSLMFKAQPGAGPFDILIGSQAIPFSAIGSGPNYTLYAANISAWAGRSEELSFSALNDGGVNNWVLDDITFSPNAVPEPSTLALLVMGGMALAARRWRAKGS